MKNAFITISNDDKRQIDKYNYMIFKEGKYSQVRET